MKINSKALKLLSLIIVLVMCTSSFSFAKGEATRDETVYVNLDSKGVPTEKISSIWLHSDTSLGTVEEKTVLKDIKNVKGEEMPKIDGNNIAWNTDKKDIFYQGTTDRDLPIEVEIKYFLDGKEIAPSDIVGESGEVKIRLELKNKDDHVVSFKNGGSRNLYTPFSSIVVMNLPLDKFTNVKINSGKVVSDGNNQVITFVSLPGFNKSVGLDKNLVDLPEYLEVKADVKDFEMGPIVITATPELPEVAGLEKAKDLNQMIDGINQIKEASEKLSEATGKLYEGQKSLNNGIYELMGGIGNVNSGASSLKDGAGKLRYGINSSYEGSKEINKGVNTLSESGKALGDGFVNLGNGAVEFSQSAKQFSQASTKVADGVAQVPEKAQDLSEGMNTIVDGTEKIKNGQDKLTDGLAKSATALEKLKKGKERELEVVNLLLKGVDGLQIVTKGLEKVPGAGVIGAKLTEGLEKQKVALEGLKDSSSQLIMGLSEVGEGIKEAQIASKELSENLDKINNGQKNIAGGASQLAKGASELKEVSEKLVQGSDGLATGAEKLNENAIKLNDGAEKFAAGSKSLSQGSEKLTEGLGALKGGADQLYNGIGNLSNGTNELAAGSKKLKEGSDKLTNGTKELDENMNKFYHEGILKLSDGIDESNIDINKIVETKDELLRLSRDYKSFTSLDNNMKGSVKFVMKTEELKEKTEKESSEPIATAKSEKGFVTWLKNLFKKKDK